MAFALGGGGRGKVRPVMNVTPLVDVVLVLLIIFMVVTPLLTKKFYVHLPPQKEAEPQPQQDDEPQLLLRLERDGTLRINGKPVAQSELPERLRRIFAARDYDVLFFDASDLAPYGQAVEVMDLARGAGAVTIGLLTEKVE